MKSKKLQELEQEVLLLKKAQYPDLSDSLLQNKVFAEVAWRLSSTYPDLSLEYIDKVETAYQKLDSEDLGSLIDVLNTKSIIQFGNGRLEDCIEIAIELIALNRINGNKKREASLYNNLGVYYRQSRYFQEALDCMLKSLELSEQLDDHRGLCNAYCNLGIAYLSVNEYQIALDYFEQAKMLGELIDNEDFLSTILRGFGTAYIFLEKYDLALEHLEGALATQNEYNSWNYPETLVALAKCKRLMNETDDCRKYLDQALEHTKETHYEIDQVDIFVEYANYFETIGEYNKAFHYLKRSKEIEEKMLAISKINKFRKKLVAFELEEKNSLIEKLSEEKSDLILQNNVLNQFAREASHDMREPIRMISSYTKLTLKKFSNKVLDASGINYLKYTLRSAEFVEQLLTNLMNYILVGNNNNENRLVDLNELLSLVQNNLRLRIESSTAQIKVESLPKVYGNPTELAQLFQNLIINSIKYSDKPQPKIHIAYKETQQAYLIKLRDNGPGIDPVAREKVFDVFTRINSDNKLDGTGLGLAICKKIADSLHGRIWIDSTASKGTTFIIQIPKPETMAVAIQSGQQSNSN